MHMLAVTFMAVLQRPQRNSKQQNKQNQPQKTTLLRKVSGAPT